MSSAAATQGPVEARSLSSITAIASNPPAYPRNPTHDKLDPLVLYIVRVPGSQDIFLSPVKPPTKSSVSAEAINASLYYLHVATPEDDALLQQVELEREEETQRKREALDAAGAEDSAQHDFVRMNNVRRKPVGGKEPDQENDAPPVPPRRPVPMPQVSAENMSFAGTPVANGQPGLGSEPATASGDLVTKNTVPRRPLPSLPPNPEPRSGRPAGDNESMKTNRWSALAGHVHGRGLDAWKEKYEALSAGRHSLDSNRPKLPPRPPQDCRGSPTRSPGWSPNRQRRVQQPPRDDTGFHITLIRRDPSSGTQWNVATISTSRMDRNAINIDVSTPGYNRFAASNETRSLANLAANLPPGMIRTAIPPASGTDQPSDQPSGPRKFHRQLCVSKPYDESTGMSRNSDMGNPEGSSSSKLKSGYYVFNSPWNGTCTFASSVNGRSLKCKHMIPGPGGHIPAHSEGEANPAVTVAEIRFNTPFQAANLHYHTAHRSHPHPHPHPHHVSTFTQSQSQNLQPSRTSHDTITSDPSSTKRNSLSQLLNPNTYTRPRAHSGPNTNTDLSSPETQHTRPNFHPSTVLRRTSLRAGRFAQFPPGPRRSTSTSSGGPDSDEDRLDFSLAREPAGGGMRGKSAKLGKLIIEDEGIKMLDLVVAACMAVWWRGYYH